ncbi:HAD family acid phosphatase [Nocardioides sp. CN2-186]|uniref:HAD family acid phosphatase n=1 Tax=Nocardioides tweenelious TaxID=3156607 RepID=UPI0032B5454C
MLRQKMLAAAVVAGAVLVAAAPTPASAALPSERKWTQDVARVMHGSDTWLEKRVARSEGTGDRLAINLDIDNSSLASHYDPGHAIPRILKFARHADELGVVLLFNTARSGRALQLAEGELVDAGYRVQELCGKTDRSEQVAHSKQRCRRHFVDEGYKIIANIGNHSTDFVGGNYERAFRLPSYGNKLT